MNECKFSLFFFCPHRQQSGRRDPHPAPPPPSPLPELLHDRQLARARSNAPPDHARAARDTALAHGHRYRYAYVAGKEDDALQRRQHARESARGGHVLPTLACRR